MCDYPAYYFSYYSVFVILEQGCIFVEKLQHFSVCFKRVSKYDIKAIKEQLKSALYIWNIDGSK